MVEFMFCINQTPNLKEGTIDQKRAEIKRYFLETVALEDSLYKLLKTDAAFYQKPESLRHPLIFYFGHTHTFFINKLYIGQFISRRVDPTFESTFAIGVDEMSWDDLDEKNYNWPTVAALKDYRKKVQEIVLNYIDKVQFTIPIDWDSAMWPILMGIEHQRIHIETSSVLIRQLGLEYIEPNEQWAPCTDKGVAPENILLPVDCPSFTIGKSQPAATYGWDNEYGTHQITSKNFLAAKFLVSNLEFKKFWLAGGYTQDEYWTPEGHQWKAYKKVSHPLFWVLNSQGEPSHLRTIDRLIELPWSWPVEVNYLEAKAFCNWKAKTENKPIRLPTEDEWYCLVEMNKKSLVQKSVGQTLTSTEYTTTANSSKDYAPANFKRNANIGLAHFASSCPVNKFQHADFFDIAGNVWQWTETPTYPFDGFKVHPLYDDFSVPTFDGKHNLIKGGSWVSTGNEELLESRYAFRRHFYQHAGMRYVATDQEEKIQINPYETDTLLSQYCEFHYGQEYFETPIFPKRCIDLIRPYYKLLKQKNKALDLGCALGRSTLELSFDFNKTIGIDFSARFIDRAKTLLEDGVLRYGICAEGELLDYFERTLTNNWTEEATQNILQKYKDSNIEFWQGDACNLLPKFSDFDLVFAGNLIDRLYAPRSFLREIKNRLVPGGILVLTSPYTWLEDYTPKSEWLGGYRRNAENLTSLQGLKEELMPFFELLSPPQKIPFVLRETKNKFQHTLSEMTIWQKKDL